MNFFLREIRADDNVKGLSLGKREHLPLKNFLKKDALKFHLENIAKTYVLVGDIEVGARVWGYISLIH